MSGSRHGPGYHGPGIATDGAPGEPAVASGLARAYSWMVAGPLGYLIPVLWVAAAVAATIYLPSFASQQGSIADITPGDLPALRAEAQASRLFPLPALSRVAVVQRDPAGLSPAVQRATIASAVSLDRQTGTPLQDLKGALPIVNAPGLVQGAKEQSTTAVTYLFFDPSVPWESQEAAAQRYAATYLDGPGGSVVGVTGTIPGRLQQSAEIEGKLGLVEIATIALVVLIVGITFRSFGAPAVALLAGVVSYLVALPVIAWTGSRLGFDVPAEVEPLVVVLLLGIVTDYTIFYLSGMRQRLASGQGRGVAARGTTAQFTPIILTAGLMVAAGTAALMVASQQFFRGFGPGMALAVLVGLVVSVTLVPALLEVFGRLLFWPRVPAPVAAPSAGPAAEPAAARESEEHSPRARRHSLATSKPVALLVTVLCVGALVVAAGGLRRTSLGLDFISGLPAGSEAKQAARAAAAGFAPGILSPTELILQKPGIAGQRDALAQLESTIAHSPGIAGVIGPREQPAGVSADLPALALSSNGGAARFLIVLGSDPLSSAGIATYDALRAAMPSMLDDAGLSGSVVSFAGDTALAQQTVSRTVDDLGRIAVVVVVIDLLLLIVFLRALIAPLYLLAASVLALAASIGVTTYLFQVVFGIPDLAYFVPFAASVLLIALGSDYNIFLVGHIWDEARSRPLRPAIESAVPRARSAISVAAVALALSFALLAIIDLTSFRQLAFLLFAGVLIDSFFVRSLLVPALVALFGRSSAWPGTLRRRDRRRSDATKAGERKPA